MLPCCLLQLCKMWVFIRHLYVHGVLSIVYYLFVSNPSDERSLRTILDSISTLTAKWFDLGIALGLSYDTLETIESDHLRNTHRCLTEMVLAWLRMKDNSQPSWQSLTSALGSPFVDRKEIAVMIAAEHRSVS